MDDIYQRLDDVLGQYADDDAACVLDVSELDGFLHALGCSPAMIPPSVWLPAMWGGAAFAPAWPDQASASAFLMDVMAHYNSVMGMLAENECAPVFLHGEVDGEEITVVDAWCEGFLLGMALWPESAAEPPDELLEPILFFTVDLDDPDHSQRMRDNTSAEELDLLQELIPQSVFGLRHYYGLDRPPPTSAGFARQKPGQRSKKPPRKKGR